MQGIGPLQLQCSETRSYLAARSNAQCDDVTTQTLSASKTRLLPRQPTVAWGANRVIRRIPRTDIPAKHEETLTRAMAHEARGDDGDVAQMLYIFHALPRYTALSITQDA